MAREMALIDEAGSAVRLEIGEATLVVQEPLMDLTVDFAVPNVDGDDNPRIIVTATSENILDC